ncbi:hypothetical protein [Alloalcanivorax xenomutans]|uniref:hypothetical protein n=1 Tax=Alloalcanivorax xenomutans TaxID=1094342 RepID=UPI002930C692|nr:hypothetical protein [Alloalcanivorax xenomutans]WOA29762.1 hypothetical protein RVY87_12820 [Alloalcanivorax xenomutans]
MAVTLRAVAKATSKIVPDDLFVTAVHAVTLRAVAKATSKIVPDDLFVTAVHGGYPAGRCQGNVKNRS